MHYFSALKIFFKENNLFSFKIIPLIIIFLFLIAKLSIFAWGLIFLAFLDIKAVDQPAHTIRFLLYRHFSLCNPISIKNEMGN